MSNIQIVFLANLTAKQREGCAHILVRALAHMPSAYPSLDSAPVETTACLARDRNTRAAIRNGQVLGWIGAIADTYPHAWELHPLAVDPAEQRRGFGTDLVRLLEAVGRSRGILTLLSRDR